MNSFTQSVHAKAFLDSLLAHTPVGGGFVSGGLCFVAVNARLAEIHGRPVADHLDRTIAEAVSPALWETYKPLVERALAGEETRDFPLPERETFLLSCYPVRLGAQIIGVTVIVREAAERREHAFVRDVLASVTEGKLWLCASAAELPPPGHQVGETIALTPETGLYALRRLAESVATAAGHSAARQNDLMIAASEAGMNAIVHAGGGAGQVSVNAHGTVQVRIVDSGSGITLENLPRAALERGFSTKATLGHGLKMLLETVDRLFLLTGPSGTTVVMEQDRVVYLPVVL